MTTTRTDSVSLPLADGGTGSMDLHLWFPDGDPKGAIIVIQEIFGCGHYIRAVAQRFADLGWVVGTPDVFWRFSPNWESGHDAEGMQASMEKAGQMDAPTAIGDCVAALEHLASVAGVATKPAVMGFCMGGTLAWGVAAQGDPSVCVSYYGSGVPSMIAMIDEVTCPTLFHFGNNDPFLANEGVEALAVAIEGREGFVINVEDAGHAFDNHESEMFYDEAAATSAWSKTVAFLDANLS